MEPKAGFLTELEQTWVMLHEQYAAAQAAGFTKDEAITLIVGMTKGN